ncbi:MAG: hypothetical protein ABIW47_16415 [Ginsengibacter sp.]
MGVFWSGFATKVEGRKNVEPLSVCAAGFVCGETLESLGIMKTSVLPNQTLTGFAPLNGQAGNAFWFFNTSQKAQKRKEKNEVFPFVFFVALWYTAFLFLNQKDLEDK